MLFTYMGITESSGSPTGEDHFFFELDEKYSFDAFPAEAISKVWERYQKPSYLVRYVKYVLPAGVPYRLLTVEKEISDADCIRIKEQIISSRPGTKPFDIYVFKHEKQFCILNLCPNGFDVSHCIPEYSNCYQHRYAIKSIPVISYPHVCYPSALKQFRTNN